MRKRMPWYFYVDEALHRLFKHYGSANGAGNRFCSWVDRKYTGNPKPPKRIHVDFGNLTTSTSAVTELRCACGRPGCEPDA